MATAMSRKRKAVVEELPSASEQIKRQRVRSSRTAPKADNHSVEISKPTKSKIKAHSVLSSSIASSVDEVDVKRDRKRVREQSPISTPQHKRFKDDLPPTPQETPTRATSRLLDRLNLAAPAGAATEKPASYTTPPLTPHSQSEDAGSELMPTTIDDSIQMFSAFLNAHSLFVAHHGAGSPLYMNELLSRITKTWRKRKVTVDDIRRLLGVLGEIENPFAIVDNGDGSMSVELRAGWGKTTTFQGKQLTSDFEKKFRRRWLRWDATKEDGKVDADAFIKSLPLAPVVMSDVAADSSIPTKGAVRLEMIKTSASQSATEQVKKPAPVSDSARTTTGITSRSTSLIDRILAKETAASSAPRGPTKNELDRLAALDRIEEVALVLDFLAGGRPRASFSMQGLVQHLQNSMRNPIARDEAERCIGLMAGEIAPRFVSVIKSGSLHGVVVTKMGRPNGAELRRRLEDARL